MKKLTQIIAVLLLGCTWCGAIEIVVSSLRFEQNGFIHSGILNPDGDPSGEDRGLAGTVKIPKGVAAESVRVELVSSGKTMAVWYFRKGQSEQRIKFNLPVKMAQDSQLSLIQEIPKDDSSSTSRLIEQIDLWDRFFNIPKQETKKYNQP